MTISRLIAKIVFALDLHVTSLMMLTTHFDEYLLTLVVGVAAQPVAGQEWQRRLLRPVNEDRRYSQDDAYL